MTLQQGQNLVFKNWHAGCTHMLGVNAPVPADDKGDGQSENAAVEFADLGIAHDYGIIHFQRLIENKRWLGAIVHGNANDLQTLIAILILQIDEMRNFLPARNTPGGPEIEKNYFSPVGGEIEFATG